MKKNQVYLEHINITVENIDHSISFFTTAFPEFKIRVDDGIGKNRWVHLGNDHTYIAINQNGKNTKRTKDYSRSGINHLGFVVNNVQDLANRLLDAGYQRSYPFSKEKFRARDYFIDSEGYEYEFIQYYSENIAERNYNDNID